MRKFMNYIGLALFSLFVSAPVMAASDTTAVTAAFGDATTGVAAIAAVMLGVIAAGIAVKWLLGFLIS